jgi:protoporphyrinogen oxidase
MSSICAEYSYLEDKKFTNSEIVDRTIEDLISLNIIKTRQEVILKDLVELNPAYAIFDFERNKNLELIKNYLNEKGIFTIGPFGKSEHSSMEDSILGGKEIAEKIIKENS